MDDEMIPNEETEERPVENPNPVEVEPIEEPMEEEVAAAVVEEEETEETKKEEETVEEQQPEESLPMDEGEQEQEARKSEEKSDESEKQEKSKSTSREPSKEATPIEESSRSSVLDEEKEPNEEEEEEDEPPLESTELGNAIDALMMGWCQLLTNVSVKPPVPLPSTLDHVKEVAEVCSKHFRDAAVDTQNELARIGVQWEIEESEQQFAVEARNLDEAIKRQEELIKSTREVLEKRTDLYFNNFPQASKVFNT